MVKKHYKSQGSVFIIAIMLLLFLSSIMYSVLRNASFLISLAKERQKSEQHYYIAYSLYCFVTEHYKDIIKQQQKNDCLLFKGPWPDKNSPYVAKALLESKGDKKIINIRLIQSTNEPISLLFPV